MSNNCRTLIMDTMKQLVVKKNFDKISINSITKECNLTRGSFYYHFQNKYELLEEIFIHDIGEVKVNTDEDIYNSAHAVLTALASNKDFYYKAFKPVDFRTFLYNFFQRYILEWIESKTYNSSLQESQKVFIVRIINYSLVGMLIKWAYTNFDESVDSLLNNFKNLSLPLQSYPSSLSTF